MGCSLFLCCVGCRVRWSLGSGLSCFLSAQVPEPLHLQGTCRYFLVLRVKAQKTGSVTLWGSGQLWERGPEKGAYVLSGLFPVFNMSVVPITSQRKIRSAPPTAHARPSGLFHPLFLPRLGLGHSHNTPPEQTQPEGPPPSFMPGRPQ